jgi:hypothetical protein
MDERTAARFWAKVNKDGPGGCWLWTAGKNGNGYGAFNIRKGLNRGAHRVSYEALVGPIPDGLDLDHLCRVRACVNPAHLEAVTRQVNLLRGKTIVAAEAARTSCPKDHQYDESNTYLQGSHRSCKICRKEAWTRWWEKDKAKRRAARETN